MNSEKEVLIEIGKRLKLLRESKGFTSYEKFAVEHELSRMHYWQIEKNPERATLKRIKELALVLQVNLITLINEDESYIQQNFNQQGGNAATQMNLNANIEAYQKLIQNLENEIAFLRNLVSIEK